METKIIIQGTNEEAQKMAYYLRETRGKLKTKIPRIKSFKGGLGRYELIVEAHHIPFEIFTEFKGGLLDDTKNQKLKNLYVEKIFSQLFPTFQEYNLETIFNIKKTIEEIVGKNIEKNERKKLILGECNSGFLKEVIHMRFQHAENQFQANALKNFLENVDSKTFNDLAYVEHEAPSEQIEIDFMQLSLAFDVEIIVHNCDEKNNNEPMVYFKNGEFIETK